MNAYDVKNFQIEGPAWMATERFDITATLPPDTTKEQFRIMLQNLLAERFKLKFHRMAWTLAGCDLAALPNLAGSLTC
jgi:uncharacterized protein (TIGR03435 family)